MAPPKWRGRLNTLVQLGTITGIVVANAINIATNNLLWGWRLSLGLAAVPGTVLVMGELPLCAFLCMSPVRACIPCLFLCSSYSPSGMSVHKQTITKHVKTLHHRLQCYGLTEAQSIRYRNAQDLSALDLELSCSPGEQQQ